MRKKILTLSMRKKILTFHLFFCIFFLEVRSQDFLGISTGNYAGVTGVMLQPASIVDSRHKFDINLFSTGINYSNNYFLVNKDALLKFNKKNFEDYSTFKERYLSEANLPAGERAFFNINNRTQLPLSFMATIGEKSAIALNLQSRSIIQGRGITGELAKLAYNGFYFPPLNNKVINASGFNLNSLNWVEAGLTYGRVLLNSDKHFIKAAFTGKYLGGVASFNMGSNDVRLSVNSDSSINLNTSNFNYNHNKNADFDMVFDKNYRPDDNAFGFDAGLVYEYRGNIDKFRYIRKDDEKSYVEDRRDINKYILKLGISLLDVGMFRFNKPANVNSFRADINNWNLHNANYNTVAEFDTALANRVVAIANDPRFYNVYLPTALSVQADLKFVRGLFLNAMVYRPISIGSSAGKRFNNYGFYTITPRWERRHFGIYLPYTFTDKNDLTDYRQNRLGATLRVGPFFVGSSNLGSMLFKDNLSAADVHVGFKVGITYGKPNKSNQFIQKIVQLKDTSVSGNTTTASKVKEQPVVPASDSNRVVIDYRTGKIYDSPNAKNNIVIINNYYQANGTPVNQTTDTIVVSAFDVNKYDTTNRKRSIQQLQNQVAIDSIRKVTADSMSKKRQQLDSLIKNMQQLQLQMDSTRRRDSLKASEKGATGSAPDNDALKNKSDTDVTSQQRRQQQLEIDNERDRAYYQRLQRQQDELFNRYKNEAVLLSADIGRLQSRFNNAYRNANYTPPPTYVTVTTPPGVNPPLTNSNLPYRRDTVYKTDTIRIIDTIELQKNDIDIISIASSEKRPSPPARDTIIKKTFDYTSMPADILLFDLGKATLRPMYHERLAFIANILNENSGLRASITGHTDNTGPAEVNKKLSLSRAENVAKFLATKGVSDQQLITQSLSSVAPAVEGNTRSANSQNRRVEIQIIKKKQDSNL